MGKAQIDGSESNFTFSEQSIEIEKPRDIGKIYSEYYL